MHDRVSKLRIELDVVQKALDQDPSSEILREDQAAYLSAFTQAALDEERFLKQNTKVEWLRVGDTNSMYFHRMVKSKISITRIDIVTSSDNVFHEGINVPIAFVNHYTHFLGMEEATNKINKEELFLRRLDQEKAVNMVMVKWIMAYVTSTSFSICVNGDFHGYFKVSATLLMEALEEFKSVPGLVPNMPKSTAFFYNVANHVKNLILQVMPFEEAPAAVTLCYFWDAIGVAMAREFFDATGVLIMLGYWKIFNYKSRNGKDDSAPRTFSAVLFVVVAVLENGVLLRRNGFVLSELYSRYLYDDDIVLTVYLLRVACRDIIDFPSCGIFVYDCTSVSRAVFDCLFSSESPIALERTKHIEIDIHFIRDFVTTCHIRVLHVPSRYQYADIFTKSLPMTLFRMSFVVRSCEGLRSSLSNLRWDVSGRVSLPGPPKAY
ncbi:hypothetical protein Tco_0016556 [Tanacetum coccineum]